MSLTFPLPNEWFEGPDGEWPASLLDLSLIVKWLLLLFSLLLFSFGLLAMVLRLSSYLAKLPIGFDLLSSDESLVSEESLWCGVCECSDVLDDDEILAGLYSLRTGDWE